LRKRKISGWKYLLLLLILAVVLYPLFWLLVSSIKYEKDIITYPPRFFAQQYTFSQYEKVFDTIPILRYVKNTIIFAGTVAFCSIFLDAAAAYAFARIKFKGRNILFSVILVTMMIPFQVLMIPLFMEIHFFGLLDTYTGLILPRLASAYGIYLMRSFFISLPRDLEEAARIDGLSEFGIFLRIMLPLCKPALITLFVFNLMANWNDLLYPLMLTSSSEMRTLPAGLAMFVGERVIQYGPTIAATILSLLPLLFLYILFQKRFVEGIAMTGIKD